MDDSFESCFAAFDHKEQSLIEGIKKLAHENEAIKQSLVHHNKVIKVSAASKDSLLLYRQM